MSLNFYTIALPMLFPVLAEIWHVQALFRQRLQKSKVVMCKICMSRLSDESTVTGMTPASGVLVKGNEWPHESDSYSCFLLFGTGVCQFVWKCYHQFFETIYEPWIIQIANVLFGKDSYFYKYILGWYFWIWKIEIKSFICI